MGKPTKKTDQDKPWNKKATLSRYPVETRNKKNTFLIFCEGVNTEPAYFKSFPIGTETEVKAIGLGRSKTSLVKKAISELEKEEEDPDRQIWCVFDKDWKGEANEDEDFNNAIQLAESQGMKVAYSNDSFELWFLLHFQLNQAALLRTAYYARLDVHLNLDYEKEGKKKAVCRNLYAKILDKQALAINHAKKLLEENENKAPAQQNPCTTVFQLVEELNKFLK